jgi:transcription elongation factor Elf1
MIRAKVSGKVTQVNQFGDFACLHCGIMFINPLNYELKAGLARCQCCGKNCIVTKEVARIANENSRKYDKALDKVIKELQHA